MVSRGINKVILIGNLGQEPDVRYMSNGGIVTNITLATTDNWRDKQTGDIKEKTVWHRVVLFGKLAEVASEYLHKGSQVYIEGSLQTRKWQDQNGQDRYTTEVIVGLNGVMQMLGSRKNNERVVKDSSVTGDDNVSNVVPSFSNNDGGGDVSNDMLNINLDDDIPF